MDVTIDPAGPLRGTVTVPADKAICHRATILCALANGPTLITPWSSADDCQRTLAIVEQLGVPVTRTAEGTRIDGVGLNGLKQPTNELDCGESGTTLRLACGILAGQPFTSRLRAGPSLSRRPMRRIVEPLEQMGARIEGCLRDHDVYPPLIIHGQRPLTAIRYVMPVASAQVKSAILLAGLYAKGRTEVEEPVQTRDHTERLLRYLGVELHAKGPQITLTPPTSTLAPPGRLTIPGDPSSAAFFIVGATLLSGSTVILDDVCLNPTRIRFIKVLNRMGARIYPDHVDTQWEPRATITAEARSLHGTTVTADEVPLLIDELPILMVAACAAEGETRFEGVQELKVKETDRLHSMTVGLRALGAQAERVGDASVVIRGGSLRGATVESFGDHRTAMSLAVAGLLAEGPTTIRGAECVAKSFPDFFDLLERISKSPA